MLLVAGIVGACGSSDDAATSADRERTALLSTRLSPMANAPEIQLGRPSSLPMVVNLWATWCAPCRAELPAFNDAATAHAGEVRFIGVNNGEDAPAATAFLAEVGSTFDHYLDPEATLQSALSVTNMPTTLFIAADGTITETHRGALDAEELDRLVESISRAPAP